jgi:hypothetical protein
MLNVNVKSQADLDRFLKEFEQLMSEINRKVTEGAFNPQDPADVEQAIRRTEGIVDEQVGKYPDNPIIQGACSDVKTRLRDSIQAQAQGHIHKRPLSL